MSLCGRSEAQRSPREPCRCADEAKRSGARGSHVAVTLVSGRIARPPRSSRALGNPTMSPGDAPFPETNGGPDAGPADGRPRPRSGAGPSRPQTDRPVGARRGDRAAHGRGRADRHLAAPGRLSRRARARLDRDRAGRRPPGPVGHVDRDRARRGRPRRSSEAARTLFATSDNVTYVRVADGFRIGAYVVLAVSLAILVRRQSSDTGRASVLDGAIVGCALFATCWPMLAYPSALSRSAEVSGGPLGVTRGPSSRSS